MAIIRDVDRADARRWNASELATHLLEARQQEYEFLLREGRQPQFYQSGATPALERHHTALAKAQHALDTIITLSNADDRPGELALRNTIAAYDSGFSVLVAAYRTNRQRLQGADSSAAEPAEAGMLTTAQAAQSGAAAVLIDAEQERDAARRHLIWAIVAVSVLSLAVAILFYYLFARALVGRITRLMHGADEIGRGHFDTRVEITSRDELGQLGQGFNQMAENLAMLIGTVQKSGIQINTSAMEISATAREQQATANEIAATTSEVGATARTISTTATELASTMSDVTEVAERTATLAGAGQSDIARMEGIMRQITEASSSINERLAVLSERAGNINTVVTTITKVADQTNLLSLNAAIEAEKAGEYGRGFSVVATEIRRLADQTAVATGDIEHIVKEIQSAVTAGVMGMDKFSEEVRRGVDAARQVGDQLTEIIHQVQTLTPNFDAVNRGMQSQAEGARNISDALSQLSGASQQTVEALAQSNQAIEQLNDASRALQTGVSRFTLHA
jgi:methyl-accepting chemotaxis protein WspA